MAARRTLVYRVRPMSGTRLTRDDAVAILHDWTKTPALRAHARMVEIAMRAAARAHGADEHLFGIAGLLHDADYEAWPDEHPARITALLRERGEEEIAYAISAHYTIWGHPAHATLDKALLACDELTGFVHACALVRPDRLRGLEPKSVIKKLKSPSFAAKVDRNEIRLGVEALGVPLDDHIRMIVAALLAHEEELGLRPATEGR
jgi:predicted hydrolase (HD superfamily)